MQQEDFNRELCDFLGRATTPFHAVQTMASRLERAGFQALREEAPWQLEAGGRYYVTRNGSTLAAFTVGSENPPGAGLRMAGAHTDSPCLMVKPHPEKKTQDYLRLGVEVYGGVLLNPWFDRDLSLAGRVTFADNEGRLGSALIDFRDPIAVIPSLAIHLDREANSQRSVNPQTDILPVLCQCRDAAAPTLEALLKSRLLEEHPSCKAMDILAHELCFYDTQGPATVGLRGEFIASARLDNLLSCFTGIQALSACDGSQSALLVCNDHEEVGSQSAAGAQGDFLRTLLRRLAGSEEAYAALVRRSMMISADNAHGIHPNFPDRHDDNHGPKLNQGPVLKINSNQRYATNSETAALFRLLAGQEEVPVQSFVTRTDMACGSTIGPITAAEIGVPTLDVGVPTFAMHSIRELAGSADAWNLHRVLRRYFDYAGPLTVNR